MSSYARRRRSIAVLTASSIAATLAVVLGACAFSRQPSPASNAASTAASAYGPGWSAAHADSSNSDYSPIQGARDLTLAWSREFPGGTINLGATSDMSGRVYVTTSAPGCHLYALDQATGETLWCSERVNRTAVSSSALLDRDGRIYLGDSEAMRAFDATGKVVWETPIVGFTLSAQFTPSGHLIFVTHIGRIYVLRRDTGAPVLPPIELIPGATYDPKGAKQPVYACMRGTEACPSANTIAMDLRTGRFFFTFFAPGAAEAGMRAMQYRESPTPAITPLWTNDSLPGGSGSSPDLSADGSRVYVNDNVDSIHALDAATGNILWSFKLGWASGGSPSTSPEGVIMPTGGGPLMALVDRGANAELLWRHDDIDNRSIATQVGGGIAYAAVAAAKGENDLIVVDTHTGVVLDREPLPGRTMFTVGTTIGPDGMVYVPTIRGQLFALRPANSAATRVAAKPAMATSSAASKAPALSEETLTFAGRERRYLVHDYSGGSKAPTVILLHGAGGNAENIADMSQFDAVARRERLIAVYPEGTSGRPDGRFRTWNAGHCCAYAMHQKVDDIGYLSALIDRLIASGRADPARIYVTGMSNGAMLTHRVGRELSSKVAAIATVVGTVFGDEPAPAAPVPALIIAGELDQIVPGAGGRLGGARFAGTTRDGNPASDRDAAPAVAQAKYWARANGCASSSTIFDRTTLTNVYRSCRNDAEVRYVIVTGNGHAWPGGRAPHPQADQPVRSFDASEAIWQFFSRHARKSE